MKNRLLFLLLSCCLLSQAQVNDDFSDGDFTANPEWVGDVAEFEIESGQLNSNGPAATSVLHLATASTSIDHTTWEFLIDLRFAPSASNKVRAYLVSDQANLESDLNGYFIEIGQSLADKIRFFRQDAASTSLLFTGNSEFTANVLTRLQITRNAGGLWNVLADPVGGTSYQSEGADFTDNTYQNTSFFGFVAFHTTSNRSLFYFDDISITMQEPPFSVLTAMVESSHSIRVTFSQSVDASTAEDVAKYSVNFGYGQPLSALMDNPDEVLLTFASDFVNNDYVLNIGGIQNLSLDETITDIDHAFSVSVPTGFRQIVVNEIYADFNPPATSLPDEEYLELYNISNQSLKIEDFKINGNPISNFVLDAGAYVILTDDANLALFSTFGEVVGVPSFPSLTNGGLELLLHDNLGNLVDSLTYDLSWYHDGVKDDGGFSIEQINPETSCNYGQNWSASTDPNGGTPGVQNSVFDNSPDLTGPNLIGFEVIDESTLKLTFDEPMDEAGLINGTYTFEPVINVNSITPQGLGFEIAAISLFSELVSGTVYTITVTSVADCPGNAILENSLSILYDIEPPVLDRIEVLTDHKISLHFDEALVKSGAENENNFSADNGLAKPASAIAVNGNKIELTFVAAFELGVENTLNISNLSDTVGNILSSPIVIGFTYELGIDTIIVVETNQLQLVFKESVEEISATNTNNYAVIGLGNPISASVDQVDDRVVDLTFSSDLLENEPLTLVVKNILNLSAEYITTPEMVFTYDTAPPQLLGLTVDLQNVVTLLFDESLDPTSAADVANYTVNFGIGSPIAAEINNSKEVQLTFENGFVNNDYTLNINGLKNLGLNKTIVDHNQIFSVSVPTGFRQIVVNEIYADFNPPATGLPDEEYLELYNVSNQAIKIENFKINGHAISDFVLDAGAYVILTDDANLALFSTFGEVVGVPSFPSLTNGGLELLLHDNLGNLVDSLTYDLSWYHDGVKDDGGFSIEQINPETSCNYGQNWSASSDPNGGTPGVQNSVFDNSPDFTEPNLIGFEVIDTTTLKLTFDEPMDKASLINGTYTFEPVISVNSITPQGHGFEIITVSLNSELASGTVHTVTVSNVADCPGNAILENSMSVLYDVESPVLDRIEVLTNHKISLHFDETLVKTSAENENNFSADNALGKPASAIKVDGNKIELTFSSAFELGLENTLNISNLSDTVGNILLAPIVSTFTYELGIDTIIVTDANQIELVFKESVEETSANNTNNYEVIGIGSPTLAAIDQADDRVVDLIFSSNFLENSPLTLTVKNILNLGEEYLTTPEMIFVYDTAPPQILGLTVDPQNVVTLLFDESLDPVTAADVSNYTVNFGFGSPLAAEITNPKEVQLTFENGFVNNDYTLNINGVKNIHLNKTIIDSNQIFSVSVPTGFRQIVINEIYADFTPSGAGLPDEEYLELYNVTDQAIKIEDFKINGHAISDFVLDAGAYVILTDDANLALFSTFGEVVGVPTFPSLTNGGLELLLHDNLGNLVDSLTYDLTWYHDPVKDDGGFSIEQINPLTSCNYGQNWSASIDPKGGTPGVLNSIFDASPDLSGPNLMGFEVINASTLKLVFDEQMDETSLLNGTYIFEPVLTISTLSSQGVGFQSVNISLSELLISGTIYTVTIDNAMDCPGNTIFNNSMSILYDVEPPVLDRIEVLTDHKISLHFDEALTKSNAENENNFSTDNALGKPSSALKVDGNKIELTFVSAFELGLENYLNISNLSDTVGNILPTSIISSFSYQFGIDTIIVVGSNHLQLTFKESVQQPSATNTNNYEVIGLGNPISAAIDQGDDRIVDLTFSSDLPENIPLTLVVKNVLNLEAKYITTPEMVFIYDTAPPTIVSYTVSSGNTIHVVFSEALDPLSAVISSNYSVNKGIEQPISVALNSQKEITLTFSQNFVNNDYVLTVNGVKNLGLNKTIIDYNQIFSVSAATGFRQIVINEIYADFTPSADGLPDEEYLELYNVTDQAIKIENFKINGHAINDFLLDAGAYVILTDDSNLALFSTFGEVVGVPSFPSLTNGSLELLLHDNLGNLVDSLTYDLTWYHDTVKDDGGFSIEQINPETSCNYGQNWSASIDPNGGTPGVQNSIFDDSPDLTAPNLIGFEVINASTLKLVFDEPMDEVSLLNGTYIFEPVSTIGILSSQGVGSQTLLITINTQLISGTSYSVTVSGVSDCPGNEIQENTLSFWFDNLPPVLDRIEVLNDKKINLYFNENLDKEAAEKEVHFIGNNGLGQPNTSVLIDPKKIQLSFATPFEIGLENELVISNLSDTLGNVLNAPFVTDFVYELGIDTLWVLSANHLRLMFKEPVQSASATNSENYLVSNSVGSPISVFQSTTDGRIVNLIFQSDFPENKSLILTTQNILDLESGFLTTPEVAFVYDTAPPKLDTSVVTSQNSLEIVFAEKVERISAESRENYEYDDVYPISAQLGADQKTVGLTFNNNFTPERGYDLYIDEVTDLYGNAISTRIKVPFLYDVFPPTVDSIFVKSPNEIVVIFNERVSLTTAENSSNFVHQNLGNPASAILDLESMKWVTLVFSEDFPEVAGQIIMVSNVADLFGNLMTEASEKRFDHDRLQVGGLSIINQNQIQVSFTKAVGQAEASLTTNYLLDGNVNPVSIAINDRIAMLTFPQIFKDHSSHELVIERIGNQNLGVKSYHFTFESRLESAVMLNLETIEITFLQKLDQIELLDISNFSLSQEIGHPVAVLISTEDARVVRLIFEHPLQTNQVYQLDWGQLKNEFGNYIPGFSTTVIFDENQPGITTIQVIGDRRIWLKFDEALQILSADFLANYSVDHGVGFPETAVYQKQDSSVLLTFSSSFIENIEYLLTVDGVKDLTGNPTQGLALNFEYVAPYDAQFGDLIITEIMAAPNEDQVEFFEIYNASQEGIALDGLIFRDGISEAFFNSGHLLPGQYLLLSQNPSLFPNQNHGTLSQWLTINNTGESLSIFNGEKLIFSTSYEENWYKADEKSDGGYSLEMVDVHNPCGEMSNWTASKNIGGTPGLPNSVAAANPDQQSPVLISAFLESENRILMEFNEKLSPTADLMAKITLEPNVLIDSAFQNSPQNTSIQIDLLEALKPKVTYELILDGLKDCVNNWMVTPNNRSALVLPEMAESQDIIVNEVLFNPRPGGVDFVELYNRSEKTIDLSGWYLADQSGDLKTLGNGHLLLHAGEYLAVTSDSEILAADYPNGNISRYFQASNFPTFNDDADSVLVFNPDRLLMDQMVYDEDFHFSLLDDLEGVSLERISFDAAGDQSDSWQSAASTVGYATPGLANSQSRTAAQSQGVVTIHPKVFFPDNTGQDDYTTINYELAQAGSFANVQVFNSHGAAVKRLVENELLSTQGFITWDGTTDSGNLAHVGYYIVYFEIFDATGNKNVYKETVALGTRF